MASVLDNQILFHSSHINSAWSRPEDSKLYSLATGNQGWSAGDNLPNFHEYTLNSYRLDGAPASASTDHSPRFHENEVDEFEAPNFEDFCDSARLRNHMIEQARHPEWYNECGIPRNTHHGHHHHSQQLGQLQLPQDLHTHSYVRQAAGTDFLPVVAADSHATTYLNNYSLMSPAESILSSDERVGYFPPSQLQQQQFGDRDRASLQISPSPSISSHVLSAAEGGLLIATGSDSFSSRSHTPYTLASQPSSASSQVLFRSMSHRSHSHSATGDFVMNSNSPVIALSGLETAQTRNSLSSHSSSPSDAGFVDEKMQSDAESDYIPGVRSSAAARQRGSTGGNKRAGQRAGRGSRASAGNSGRVTRPTTKGRRGSSNIGRSGIAARVSSASLQQQGQRIQAPRNQIRPFSCPLSPYGCRTTFATKNEWKRHINIQHVALGFYRCDHCPDVQIRPNDFNRKDLFTQHLRRMHLPSIRAEASNDGTSTEAVLDVVRDRCWIQQRTPPSDTFCIFCNSQWVGSQGTFDEWLEHVGRHLATDSRGGIGIPWADDLVLQRWLLGQNIIRQGARPGSLVLTTGDDERSHSSLSDGEDAEGEPEA